MITLNPFYFPYFFFILERFFIVTLTTIKNLCIFDYFSGLIVPFKGQNLFALTIHFVQVLILWEGLSCRYTQGRVGHLHQGFIQEYFKSDIYLVSINVSLQRCMVTEGARLEDLCEQRKNIAKNPEVFGKHFVQNVLDLHLKINSLAFRKNSKN